jgi:glycosyltransferase involved in cell wall biosynthesis
MKIHIHTPSYFPQLVGMTYASEGHADILTELGHDVTIMVADRQLSVEIRGAIKPWRAIGSGIEGRGMPWDRLRGDVSELLAFTAQDRPDLIIIEGWYTSAAALIPRFKSLGIKVILASHGAADTYIDDKSPSQIIRAMAYYVADRTYIMRLARLLDAVLILSSYRDKARFADVARYDELGVPAYVCPNFSIYQRVSSARTPPINPTLIHIGEMLPHKNQMLGVELLAHLPEHYRMKFIYPVDTNYGLLVKNFARSCGVTDRVIHVTGKRRHEIESDIESADCLLILTASKDVQPIVAVDAMTKAVPFVSTRVGCMPQMEGGIVTDGTPEAMAAAVEEIFLHSTYVKFSKSALDYSTDMLSREKSKLGIQKMLKAIHL